MRALSVLQAPYKRSKFFNKRARKVVALESQSVLFFSTSLPGVSEERYRYGTLPTVARLVRLQSSEPPEQSTGLLCCDELGN